MVKTADFGAADPVSNPLQGEKIGPLFQSNLKESEAGRFATPVIPRLGGVNYWSLGGHYW